MGDRSVSPTSEDIMPPHHIQAGLKEGRQEGRQVRKKGERGGKNGVKEREGKTGEREAWVEARQWQTEG